MVTAIAEVAGIGYRFELHKYRIDLGLPVCGSDGARDAVLTKTWRIACARLRI